MGRLFWKIFAGFWITLLLTVLVISAALTIRHEALRSQDITLAEGPHNDYAVKITWLMFRHGGEHAVRSLSRNWISKHDRMPLVVDQDGHDLLGRTVPADALKQARERLETGNLADRRGLRTFDTGGGKHYIIFQISDPASPPRPRHLFPPFRIETPVGMMLAAILASLAVSALLARHFSRPIRKLQNAFKAASSGQLDIRVGDSVGNRHDEIGDLGREFDGMALHLQQLVGSQNRLLHDVSHELRSPLARLQVAVGLARQNPTQLDTALSRIERESERLDILVGEILTLSRLETRGQEGNDDYVDPIELVASVIDDARFEAESTGQRILFHNSLQEEVVIRARGKLLHRAVENIVRNALQHTPSHSTISVSTARDPLSDNLCITVEDCGNGIPEKDIDAIFEPFFRSENASGRGYGLGLAIAKRAIEVHGGSIQASNRPQGGLAIHIRFPIPAATPQ